MTGSLKQAFFSCKPFWRYCVW